MSVRNVVDMRFRQQLAVIRTFKDPAELKNRLFRVLVTSRGLLSNSVKATNYLQSEPLSAYVWNSGMIESGEEIESLSTACG